jgi:excisionase family DNA binding protein
MGYSKLKIPKICEHCGKPFEAKTVITRFCSADCGHKADNARKKAVRKEAKQQELIAKIPSNRPYISIAEAVLLFGILRDALYRLVRLGKIPAINFGERLTRISRAHIETMFAPVAVRANTLRSSNQENGLFPIRMLHNRRNHRKVWYFALNGQQCHSPKFHTQKADWKICVCSQS